MSRATILLKSPPEDATTDPYVRELKTAGYTSHFVGVLESTISNEQALQAIVRMGPTHAMGFAAVVITSSRAADAWMQAILTVGDPGDWSKTPFYVVGESTGRVLKQMTVSHPTKFSAALILGAGQAGKSESLAYFILADLPSRHTTGKLLYLTGDKNRDIFHRVMSENDVELEGLMVYETAAAHDLSERVTSVVHDIEKGKCDTIWIIFFAPSSSGFALPHLRKYFQLSQVNASPDSVQDALPNAKVGAIGPTTATYLQSVEHLRVDAVPPKPTAVELVAFIRESDSNGKES